MDNDTYALEQLKLQEAYWVERGRLENLPSIRHQIASVEARIADRLLIDEAARVARRDSHFHALTPQEMRQRIEASPDR